MINIIDFDYTLFDTLKFRQVALPEFFGQTYKEFDLYYQKVRNRDQGFYSAVLNIEELPIDILEKERLKQELPKYLSEIQVDYLIDGASELLIELKKRGDTLILLTRGDTEWQRIKLENLIINEKQFLEYFDRVIYVEHEHKHQNAAVLEYRDKRVRFINDNAKENQELMKMFTKNAEFYLVKSEHSRNIEHNNTIWPDLRSIKQEIMK